MYLGLGWVLIAMAGFLMMFLCLNTWSKEKRGETLAIILVMAVSWIAGCILVGYYHVYWYLYCVNVVAAGKYLFHMVADHCRMPNSDPVEEEAKASPEIPDIYD